MISRKFIFTFLLVSFVVVRVWAEIENPLYYSVSYNGKTSHILGTIHFGVPLEELPSAVMTDLTSSSTILQEYAFDPKDAQLMLTDFEGHFFELHAKFLAKWPKKTGVQLDEVQKQELINRGIPASIAQKATSSQCKLASGGRFSFPKLISMDMQIRVLCDQAQKKMIFLDSDELLKQSNEKFSEPDCDLREKLKEPLEESQAESDLLKSAYRSGDEYYITAYSFDGDVEFRNLNWMPQILTAFQEGDAFLAVGAAHLFGDQGILLELQRRGAVIERYSSPASQTDTLLKK